jgi:hypothetical protein
MFYFTILQHPGPRTEHQNLRIYHGHQPSEFSMEADCFFGQLEKISGWNPKLYMSNMLDILFNPTGLWVVSIFDFSRYAAMVSRLFQQL